ncbi:hypothetical protein LJR045_002933 [Microbacterium sp. LjRoot45]|uniref:hypothetical protein n=1 Tax=Microbacterium sp. LjRoot45 TaxID=3342329 RepID=UPI003ECE2A81
MKNQRIEIKTVTYRGDPYRCAVKHQLIANGTIGASWFDSARDRFGQLVTDDETINALRLLLGLSL